MRAILVLECMRYVLSLNSRFMSVSSHERWNVCVCIYGMDLCIYGMCVYVLLVPSRCSTSSPLLLPSMPSVLMWLLLVSSIQRVQRVFIAISLTCSQDCQLCMLARPGKCVSMHISRKCEVTQQNCSCTVPGCCVQAGLPLDVHSHSCRASVSQHVAVTCVCSIATVACLSIVSLLILYFKQRIRLFFGWFFCVRKNKKCVDNAWMKRPGLTPHMGLLIWLGCLQVSAGQPKG